MRKRLHRMAAILLLPCFIADPGMVCACAPFQSANTAVSPRVFSEQALAPALADWMVSPSRRLTQGIGAATQALVDEAPLVKSSTHKRKPLLPATKKSPDLKAAADRIQKAMEQYPWTDVGNMPVFIKEVGLSPKVFRAAMNQDEELRTAISRWKEGKMPHPTLSANEQRDLLKRGMVLVDARREKIVKVPITRARIAAALGIELETLDIIPNLGSYIDRHKFDEWDTAIFNALIRVAVSIERPRGKMKMQSLARWIQIDFYLLVAACSTTPLIEQMVEWACAGEWDRIAPQKKGNIVKEKPAVSALRKKLDPLFDTGRFVKIALGSQVPLPRLTNFVKQKGELTAEEVATVSRVISELAAEDSARQALERARDKRIAQAA